MSMRAGSVKHAEYEIIEYITQNIDLSALYAQMAVDVHSKKRFDTAAENLVKHLDKMAATRRKSLPKSHPDKED